MSNIIKFTKSLFSLFLIYFCTITSPVATDNTQSKIVVIVPLEHEAMTQILAGIKESLSGSNVNVIAQNAQGDPNIMLAMIKQINQQDVDIIMPIGTSTSQMTIAHIHNKPIICVAADLKNSQSEFVTGVNDEIPVTASLSKLHKLRNIAVIYSASEKVFPEIEALKAYGKKHNLKLHLSMVQSLVDLPITSRSIPQDVDAFLILKDHLIVSGVNILMQEANKRQIPLIASDEGSVINGATLAIGVQEKNIGVLAGKMAKEILLGSKPRDIPYKTIEELTLFINAQSFQKQNILTKDDLAALEVPQVIVPAKE